MVFTLSNLCDGGYTISGRQVSNACYMAVIYALQHHVGHTLHLEVQPDSAGERFAERLVGIIKDHLACLLFIRDNQHLNQVILGIVDDGWFVVGLITCC